MASIQLVRKLDFDAHLAETVIKQNLTINVPADYPTIQAALDALKYAWIPRDVTVTIQVAAGTYTHTSPIVVDHPCGSQIRITGATPITTTITGVGTVSGSAGAWSVPITVADVTGIQVGQYAIIRNTTGTGDYYAHRGIWEITAVDTGTKTVTVKNTHRASTFPTATLSGGDFIVLPTILKFNNSHGVVCYDTSLGLLDKVVIVGVNSTTNKYGIFVGKGADTDALYGGSIHLGDYVGITGFFSGIRVSGGSIIGKNIASCNNAFHGFFALASGVIHTENSIANGNNYGFFANTSSTIIANNSVACGNSDAGFAAGTSASVYTDYSVANGNGTGYSAFRASAIKATYSIANNNINVGFGATDGSAINAEYSTASGNPYGFRALLSGHIRALSSTATGNTIYGYQTRFSGSIYAGDSSTIYSTASNNDIAGFCAEYGGSIWATYCTASNNGPYGFIAQFGGVISADYSNATGHTTADYFATDMSFIKCPSYVGTPVFSPALNTEGNYNSIIRS